jgi:DNA-binding beta-propeller fold protein YncE
LLKTISLADCGGFCDGLEYFVDSGGNPRLISNEGDGATPGVYDVYDTNGNLITHNFINTGNTSSGTGIAYDGTNFFVSNLNEGTISVYSNAGAFVRTMTITGFPSGFSPLVEDLSVDYPASLGSGAPLRLRLWAPAPAC